MKINKKLIFLALAAMAMGVTGCASSPVSEPKATAPVVTSNTIDDKVSTETVIVAHELGETEVTKNPKNIVVMDLGILDALDGLGIAVTGVPSSSAFPEYLSAYANEEQYTNIGSLKELNMEKVFEVAPELIIISSRQADYYEELSKIAPTIHLGVDNEDYLGSFKGNMNYLGQIFEKEEEVAAKIETIEKQMKEVSVLAAEKNANGLITLSNDGAFSVYGKDSRFGIIHNEFGIKPVDETIESSTHGQKASFEYVVEKNPDYLFVIDRVAVAGGKVTGKMLFDNELIKKTAAYKNNRIIYLDANVWYTATGGFTGTQKMVDEITQALKE